MNSIVQVDPIKSVGYPSSKISLFPTLSFGAFQRQAAVEYTAIQDAGTVLPVTTGRMGLSLALEHMGIKQGDKILIPGYHCNSMVEPLIHRGAEPVFYNIHLQDASVDLASAESKLDGQVRAMMVTHYFGFPQDLTKIRAFCDKHGLALIEDCAHVCFGEHAGRPLGSYGDYTFASPMKFYAIYDGGYLISARHAIKSLKLSSAGVKFDLKGVRTVVGRALKFKRFGLFRHILAIPFQLSSMLKNLGNRDTEDDGPVGNLQMLHQGRPVYGFDGYFSGQAGEYDPAWIHTRMSRISRMIIATSAKTRIISLRRKHYQQLLQALSGLNGCRPLYPDLPDSVVPYLFPLVVDKPEHVFPALKHYGIPISRFGEYFWEGIDMEQYPDVEKLAKCVMQFPCHQEMTQAEMDWMIAEVVRVIKTAEVQSTT